MREGQEGGGNVNSSPQSVRGACVRSATAIKTDMLTLTRESHGASPVCE